MIYLPIEFACNARTLIQSKIDSLNFQNETLAKILPTVYCGDVIQSLSFPSNSLVLHYSCVEDISLQDLHYSSSILISFTLNPIESIQSSNLNLFDLVILDFCHVYPSSEFIRYVSSRITNQDLFHDRFYLLFSPRKFFKLPIPSIIVKPALHTDYDLTCAEPITKILLVSLAILIYGILLTRTLILNVLRHSIHCIFISSHQSRRKPFFALLIATSKSISYSLREYHLSISMFIRSLPSYLIDSTNNVSSYLILFLAASESYMLYKLSKARSSIEDRLDIPSLSSQYSQLFLHTELLAIYFDNSSYIPKRMSLLYLKIYLWGDICQRGKICTGTLPAYTCIDIINYIPVMNS